MKKILLLQSENKREYYIRLEIGEELHKTLSDFAIKENIGFATFSGLGANKNTDYGEFFDGNYNHLFKKEQCELNSINGNIGWKENKPMIHAHAMFSKMENGNMINYAGHIFAMESAVTIELSLIAYDNKIERVFAPECKLNLLDLEKDMNK